MIHPRCCTTILALAVVAAVMSVPVAAQLPDHLKCYKIKDSLKLAGTVDLDTPEFGVDAGCRISTAKFFCVPASKTNVAVVDKPMGNPLTLQPVTGPDPGDRICYKVKCTGVVAPQEVTDQFGTRTVRKLKAALVCTPAVKGPFQRFVDNGDGTVTDRQTGLQWEKKDGADGEWNLDNPHDVDNLYLWSATLTAADGNAFTDFLGKLNNCVDNGTYPPTGVTGGFAGHCDWRLPTIAELQTILLAPFRCPTIPCIDPVFGPTVGSSYYYWSSTTYSVHPDYAFHVNFFDGSVVFGAKYGNILHVRAVRGGSWSITWCLMTYLEQVVPSRRTSPLGVVDGRMRWGEGGGRRLLAGPGHEETHTAIARRNGEDGCFAAWS